MLARPARGELLDRVDEHGRRRHLDALRPDEKLVKRRAASSPSVSRPAIDVAEPPDVLVERLRDLDEPAADLAQVAVVEHAALRRGECGTVIVCTALPMIPASIIALVLMPKTTALW